MSDTFNQWIKTIPKAELHLHIDGSLQASRLLSLAKKHKITLPYSTIEDVHNAYNFSNLQEFLDLYYLGASVLKESNDFYHLMMDYLLKCKEQNIVHTEIMVEPQTYAPNGVSFATMMQGFTKAIDEAKASWGQSVLLILSFLRHLSEEEALKTLQEAKAFRSQFVAIGLASSEVGNPPEKFKKLYAEALKQGYKCTAHAGEEGPAAYIWDSIRLLHVSRIDHGVNCVQDTGLMEYLVKEQLPLTVCPLSNVRLGVFKEMKEHTVLALLRKGLLVTINSDDPTYFGGFLNANFEALHDALGLGKEETLTLIENSFKASYLKKKEINYYLSQIQKLS